MSEVKKMADWDEIDHKAHESLTAIDMAIFEQLHQAGYGSFTELMEKEVASRAAILRVSDVDSKPFTELVSYLQLLALILVAVGWIIAILGSPLAAVAILTFATVALFVEIGILKGQIEGDDDE